MEERSSRFIWQDGDLELVSSPYWIDSQPRSVRAWVPFRPPFQPKPQSIPWHFRADLRRAVSTLEREPDNEILRCVYTNSGHALVDTENVLVYNLGPGYLAPAGASGIRFVRTYADPPTSPVTLDPGGPIHYLEYGFTEPSSEESTKKVRLLAAWQDALWPGTTSVPKVGALWFALRTTKPTVYGCLDDSVAPFGIRIEIGVEKPVLHPVHVLKPLLDSVVSAFHLHAADDADVTAHVAEQARTPDMTQVGALLGDEHYNVLGGRAVVGLYRGGVKWNPADERCVLAQIVLKHRAGRPTFSGELFAIG